MENYHNPIAQKRTIVYSYAMNKCEKLHQQRIKRIIALKKEQTRDKLTIKQMAERHNVCYERMRQLLKAD